MPVEQVLTRAGGCLLRRDLVRTRADARELETLVALGRVVRISRGVYALPTAPADVVAARLTGGVLTCVTVARQLGLPLLDEPSAPHVAIHSSRRVPREGALPPGTRVHWDARLPLTASDRVRCSSEAPSASVALALVHALGCLPGRDVVALWDAALNRRYVQLADLVGKRPPRAGRRAFDAVLRSTDGRSESMPETFVRLAARRLGLLVEPQALVEGVGFVDLLVERRVAVEVDGYAFHSGRVAFAEDRRRDRSLLALGLVPVRYTFVEAVRDTRRVAMEIREMVRSSVASRRPVVDPQAVAARARPPQRRRATRP